MRSGNKRLYEKNVLQTLVNEKYSCITSKLCERKIELQAKHLKEVKLGIKEALDKGLNKYDYSLNGILLDYRSLRVLEDKHCGKIVGKCGEFIVTIKAEFYVFQPEIGDLLKGVVNVKSDSHVGCLVHKCFNAMILKPENVDSQSWNCKNIQIGDEIIFKIVDHVFSGHVPYIEGVISDDQTETSTKKKKSKKKKHDSLPLENVEQNGYCSSEELMKGIRKSIKEFDDENLSNFDAVEEVKEKTLSETLKKKKSPGIQEESCVDNSSYDFETFSNTESNRSKVKKKKKKKDHDQEAVCCPEQGEEPISQLDNSAIVSNLKEIQPKVSKESESNAADAESFKTKKKKKKHDKEKVPEIDESDKSLEMLNEKADGTPKKKKKKKDKDKEKEVKEKDKTSGDESETVSELIDSLMNIVPSDFITSEVTPKKPASPICTKPLTPLECEKTPVKQILSSTNKRKRNESNDESQAKAIGDNLSSPSGKKIRLEEALTALNLKRSHERSLFSDSDESLRSPKKTQTGTPSKPGKVHELSISGDDECQWKNTGEEEVIIPLDRTKKSKKRKSDKSEEKEGKPEKNRSKTSDIEHSQTDSNRMKVSPKKEKENKSSPKTKALPVSEKTKPESFQDVPLTSPEKNGNPSMSNVKILNKSDPALSKPAVNKDEPSPSSKSKSRKKNGGTTRNPKQNLTDGAIQTKTFHIGDSEFDKPVVTSTPKTESKKVNGEAKKDKKRKGKSAKQEEAKNAEKEEMIKALLQSVRLSLGMNEDENQSNTKSEGKKRANSIEKYLIKKGKKGDPNQIVQNNLSEKEIVNISGSNSGLNSVV